MHYLNRFPPRHPSRQVDRRGRHLDTLFVINPHAGPAAGNIEVEAAIQRVFGGSGRHYEVVYSTHPGHATDLTRAGTEAGCRMVVAVGGDGTVNEVGRTLVGKECALGILPRGSGNALARALGIPIDPDVACRLLLDCRTVPLDAGMIDGRLFLSTSGIGLDAQVSARYACAGRRGFLPYAKATAAALWHHRPESVSVTVDGVAQVGGRLALLTIANTPQFGYGLTVAPGASWDDGVLDLCMVEDPGVARLLWHGIRHFRGAITSLPGVTRVQGRHIHVERSAPGLLQTDGEAHMAGAHLHARVVPGAITVGVADDPR